MKIFGSESGVDDLNCVRNFMIRPSARQIGYFTYAVLSESIIQLHWVAKNYLFIAKLVNVPIAHS